MTNKAELIDVVAEATGTSKAAAGEALDAVIAAITNALQGRRGSSPRWFWHFLRQDSRRRQGPQPGHRHRDRHSGLEERPLQARRSAQDDRQQISCVRNKQAAWAARTGPSSPSGRNGRTLNISPAGQSASPDLFGLRGIYGLRSCSRLGRATSVLPACGGRFKSLGRPCVVRLRAVSSVGRASRLHREGRRFETVTAHQIRKRTDDGVEGRVLFSRVDCGRGGLYARRPARKP